MGKSRLDGIDPVQLANQNTIQSRDRQTLTFGMPYNRSPLLSAYGTRARDIDLNRLWHDDFNTMFKGVVSGLAKKVASTPFEINSPKRYGDFWQRMLMDADLGKGWSAFIQKIVTDFCRYDTGAFIELIASGDPLAPITTPVIGVASLDPLNCWLTGEDDYPVVYQSGAGKMHYLHHTRVAQLVDMPTSEDNRRGFGVSAMSRAIAVIAQEMYIQKYMITLFDDNPPPGFVIFGNLGGIANIEQAIAHFNMQRQTDSGGLFGRTIPLYGLDSATTPTVQYITFSRAPDGFDYTETMNILAKQMANAIGVDLIEFWELSGGNIGSATQAEIMAQKSKGKMVGYLIKEIERLINSILPEDCTFEFRYRDEEELKTSADIANQWAIVVNSLANQLTSDEQRMLLIKNVEAIRDVLTDDEGQLIPYNDFDRVANDELVIPDNGVAQVDDTDLMLEDNKEIGQTISAFAGRMIRMVNAMINKFVNRAIARGALRTSIALEGEKAFLDGKRAAGDNSPLSADDKITLLKWRSEQQAYLTTFLDNVEKGVVTPNNLTNHVEMWINKTIKEAYNLGMASTAPNRFYRWVLGATIEHCQTCLTANGQVHRMKAWKEAGVLPQSSRLQCGGYHCDCRLEPVTNPRLFGKGNLQAVRRTLKAHEREHKRVRWHDSEDVLWSKH